MSFTELGIQIRQHAQTALRRPALYLLPICAALAHPLCDFYYQCGCTWLGSAQCNIHHAPSPDCPWCTVGVLRLLPALAGFALAIGGATWAAVRILPRRRLWIEILAGVLAFVAAGYPIALAYGLWVGYPGPWPLPLTP